MKGGIVFGIQALRKGVWRWIWIIRMHQNLNYKPAYITNVSFVFFFSAMWYAASMLIAETLVQPTRENWKQCIPKRKGRWPHPCLTQARKVRKQQLSHAMPFREVALLWNEELSLALFILKYFSLLILFNALSLSWVLCHFHVFYFHLLFVY